MSKRENRKKWIAALRSGKYTQGVFKLQEDNRFCCLGVSCKVAEEHGIELAYDTDENNEIVLLGDDLSEQEDVMGWLGFKNYHGYRYGHGKTGSIIYLNDGSNNHKIEPHSFAEIADIIEKNIDNPNVFHIDE